MKSSHHIQLETIECQLAPNSCFLLHAARHKALVIRDALTEDKAYCDGLLLKIEHLLGEVVVTPVNPVIGCAAGTPAEAQRASNAA
jgi:hypothetical protein